MNSRGPFILIGPSGSGKSYVGNELAKLTGFDTIDPSLALADNPDLLTEAFVKDPEESARRLIEYSLLALKNPDSNSIIELPPSAPMDPRVRAAISQVQQAGGFVTYLHANLETLARRSGLNAPQPGYIGMPRAWFRQLNEALDTAYQGQYDFECDTTHADSVSVAEKIVGQAALN